MATAPGRLSSPFDALTQLRKHNTELKVGHFPRYRLSATTVTDTLPILFVCHGDAGGPPFHPCRRVQEALRAAGIEYTKIIAGHGSPFPWLRGPRPELLRMTGTNKLPTLKLPDGTILIHPRGDKGRHA